MYVLKSFKGKNLLNFKRVSMYLPHSDTYAHMYTHIHRYMQLYIHIYDQYGFFLTFIHMYVTINN